MPRAEKYYSFLSTIKWNIWIYKLFGIWPPRPERSNKLKRLFVIKRALIWTNELVFFITQLMFVCKNFQDLQAITGTLYILITFIGNILKKITNSVNINRIKDIIYNANDDKIFNPHNNFQKAIATKEKYIYQVIYIMYSSSGILSSIFWFLPFFDKKQRNLPLMAWFPFDYKSSPNYELLYIWQIMTVYYNSILCINMDTFAVSLMQFVGLQCDFISNNLENINFPHVNRKFLNCIEHHRRILKMKNEIENLFDFSIVFQFFGSTCIICFTFFQITLVCSYVLFLYKNLMSFYLDTSLLFSISQLGYISMCCPYTNIYLLLVWTASR